MTDANDLPPIPDRRDVDRFMLSAPLTRLLAQRNYTGTVELPANPTPSEHLIIRFMRAYAGLSD